MLQATLGYAETNGDRNTTDRSERIRRELIRMRRHRLKRRIFSHFEGRYLWRAWNRVICTWILLDIIPRNIHTASIRNNLYSRKKIEIRYFYIKVF